MQSVFVKKTPDDGNDPNRIRLFILLSNKIGFTAKPENFLEALQKNELLYHEIPISDNG